MTEIIWVALIATTGTIVSPMILAIITNRGRHADKLEDFARQDAVAAKAEEAAALLLRHGEEVAAQAAEAATLLLAANERVAGQSARATKTMQTQLNQIHTLVNSQLTAAMRAELTATEALLPLMHEVIALNQVAGRTPDPASLTAEQHVKARIDDLTEVLKDRGIATKIANQATP